MDQMHSSTPPIPVFGGHLVFNGLGIAACTSCGWRGVANRVGGRRKGQLRRVLNPYSGEWEMTRVEIVGDEASTFCPACEVDKDEGKTVAQMAAEVETTGRVVKEYAGTPRNAPCPCGSGVKYKKCHGA